MTRLFVARWPGGIVTVLSGESPEHVADLLDQVGDASECEVTPLAGELWLTVEPSTDANRGPLALLHRSTIEIDSQAAIVKAAYPVLHRLLEAATVEAADGDLEDEPIDGAAWTDAAAIERDRILAPSPTWKAAVLESWDSLSPEHGDED